MMSTDIPSILQPKNPGFSAISTERALKNILHHLKNNLDWVQLDAMGEEDSAQAAIDDCKMMLAAIKRED